MINLHKMLYNKKEVLMKKIISSLLVLCLVACGSKEEEKIEVLPPTSNELGNVCTIVTEFDDDMYNISLFYTENETYPILNKDEFNYINQLGLKYSEDGSKDVSKYKINQNNAMKLCNLENAQVVNVAMKISDSNILKFITELKAFDVYYEIEKENETFRVEIPNQVISTTKIELNYTRVYSLEFSEDELNQLASLPLKETKDISLNEEHPIFISYAMADLIDAEGNQNINSEGRTKGLGEAVQLIASIASDTSIAVDYVPVMTLVKFLKEDVNESSYVQFDNRYYMLSELKDYILYETEEIIVYDFNTYLFGDNIKAPILKYASVNSVESPTYEITEEILNGQLLEDLYLKCVEEVKKVIK